MPNHLTVELCNACALFGAGRLRAMKLLLILCNSLCRPLTLASLRISVLSVPSLVGHPIPGTDTDSAGEGSSVRGAAQLPGGGGDGGQRRLPSCGATSLQTVGQSGPRAWTQRNGRLDVTSATVLPSTVLEIQFFVATQVIFFFNQH